MTIKKQFVDLVKLLEDNKSKKVAIYSMKSYS